MKEGHHYRSFRQKRIRKHHKQLYANKFDNVDKMEKFLERHKLSDSRNKRLE